MLPIGPLMREHRLIERMIKMINNLQFEINEKKVTSFDDLPEDWICPVCFAPKQAFKKIQSFSAPFWRFVQDFVLCSI